MTLGKRLRVAREWMGLTQVAVYKQTGINNKTLSGYENGVSEPDTATLSTLAQLYNVSLDFLINGLDNVVKKSDNSTYTRENVDVFREGTLGELFDPGEMVYVPIVADVSCGQPAFTEDGVIGYLPILTAIFPISNKDDYFAIRAKGDSMIDADIKDGSFVLIHKQSAVENGDIAAVCVRSENATLKRVHVLDDKVVLSPANPKYAPQTYPPEDIRIVGKAIMVTKAL